MGSSSYWTALVAAASIWLGNFVEAQLPGNAVSPYAPTLVQCPNIPLLRSGGGLNSDEKQWVKRRHQKASASLKSFLRKKDQAFPELNEYPQIGMANGGGGIRGFLTAAGHRLAWDGREGNNFSTSGLYQAVTYETGLSGSSIMLGSFADGNQPRTSDIYEDLWKFGFNNGLFMPKGPEGSPGAYAQILTDVSAKAAAGADVSLIDALGRLFGYVAFKDGRDGPAGAGKKWSNIMKQPAFRDANAPLPILVSLGIEEPDQGCGLPDKNASQYELGPFEFGSFDRGIKSFTPMKYLGSALDNGKPAAGLLGERCFTGFDNSNFIVGTSTAILNQFCGSFVFDGADAIIKKNQLEQLQTILKPLKGLVASPFFSVIPNPAFNSPKSPKVNKLQKLNLIDGGENIQVIPISPLVWRPEVKVMWMSDSSTYGATPETRVQFPNGRSLVNSANNARLQGKGDRFPRLPRQKSFLKQGLTKRAVFFGCNLKPNDPAATIVYLPNRKLTFDSGVKTNKNQYTFAQSKGILYNGAAVASENYDKNFGYCVGCVTIKRQAEAEGKKLPSKCQSCFKKYCYN